MGVIIKDKYREGIKRWLEIYNKKRYKHPTMTEAVYKHDFNKMCEVSYNKMVKELLKDPLIKKIVKELNEKEVKKMKYFETKVVKVKKEKKIKCEQPCNDEYYCFCCKYNFTPKQPKGNYVNGENIDKIKFPCFCSYNGNRYGLITRTKANEYYDEVFYTLHSIDKQRSSFSSIRSYINFRDLINVWDIHILKGKIIIYEEE